MSTFSPRPAVLDSPGLVLLTAGTPNGIKVSVALEELKEIGAVKSYEVVPTDFSKNDQKSPWFESVNPNGRIPALLHNREDKAPLNVFESASIVLYLERVFDKGKALSFPTESDEYQHMLDWIFFLQGGVGPMQGQANHFFRYAPEKIQYGIDRYQNETRRLYSVYEKHLATRAWLVGDKYSYADIISWSWIRSGTWAGVDLAEFPKLSAWVDKIEDRPAVKRGVLVPDGKDKITELRKNPELAEEEARKAREWIMKGVEADKKK